MPFRKWELSGGDPRLTRILAEECGISPLAAAVLAGRGHTSYEEIAGFLAGGEELADPFELEDMAPAAERLRRAIDEGERITVYGDYDCDGVTATAMLYIYLSSMGADVCYYIPERDGEGYGLNLEAVREIAGEGGGLLVTVDNGISALEEIACANELGMEVIVTDHHQPGDTLPPALAVVDPHRRDDASGCRYLCGAGVVFKLIAALEDGDYQIPLEQFGDLVAVGTIGDIVPLVGENRFLVQNGLRRLAITDNPGLSALMEAAAVRRGSLSAQTVAFSLAPRINAAGRMGSAGLAVRLLLSEDQEESAAIAAEMDQKNKDRQSREQEIVAEAEELIRQDPSLLEGRLLILRGDSWSHGIIGIVCSRLLERYGKPVLLCCGEEDGSLRGSGRSLGEFHLFKALSACAKLLTRYGGHKLAAGFSLRREEFEDFRQAMEDWARREFPRMPQPILRLDRLLEPEDLTLEAVESLGVLEPFGAENEPPVFLLKDALLRGSAPLSGGKHQRLSLEVSGRTVNALLFGVSQERFFYRPGQRLDLAVTLEVNEYNGQRSVSVKVRDLRPAGFPQEKFFNAKDCYQLFRRGEPIQPALAKRAAPSREEAALVYRFLKARQGYAGEPDALYAELLAEGKGAAGINYCKLRILLDILAEAELITLSPLLTGITLRETEGRSDLNRTPTRRRLQEEYGC